jgi:hypothetical protein
METMVDVKIINEIIEQMDSVPFGNSAFQNRFLTDGHESPERRKRVVLLQLDARIEALQQARFSLDRQLIDIDELRIKMEQTTDRFEKRRLEVDLDEKLWAMGKNKKLIKDAMIEVATFHEELKTLPSFTREEFEKAELPYWETRFGKEALLEMKYTGHVSSGLMKEANKIGLDVKVENGQIQVTRDQSLLEGKV